MWTEMHIRCTHPEGEGVWKSLSLAGDILCLENPKDATPKLLERKHEFSKVEGYKINIQKSVAFLFTNNEMSERKNTKKNPI